MWSSPDAPRPVDEPAVADEPDVAAWTSALDTSARRDLHDRTETQLHSGEPVVVVEVRPAGLGAGSSPLAAVSQGSPGLSRLGTPIAPGTIGAAVADASSAGRVRGASGPSSRTGRGGSRPASTCGVARAATASTVRGWCTFAYRAGRDRGAARRLRPARRRPAGGAGPRAAGRPVLLRPRRRPRRPCGIRDRATMDAACARDREGDRGDAAHPTATGGPGRCRATAGLAGVLTAGLDHQARDGRHRPRLPRSRRGKARRVCPVPMRSPGRRSRTGARCRASRAGRA